MIIYISIKCYNFLFLPTTVHCLLIIVLATIVKCIYSLKMSYINYKLNRIYSS